MALSMNILFRTFLLATTFTVIITTKDKTVDNYTDCLYQLVCVLEGGFGRMKGCLETMQKPDFNFACTCFSESFGENYLVDEFCKVNDILNKACENKKKSEKAVNEYYNKQVKKNDTTPERENAVQQAKLCVMNMMQECMMMKSMGMMQ